MVYPWAMDALLDPAFDTQDQALAWLLGRHEAEGEFCIDNERFAFIDDEVAMAAYEAQTATGCCGSDDVRVVVAGRPAMVGCNYGH